MNRQNCKAAEAAIERSQHFRKAIGAPDQRQNALRFENPARRVNPILKRCGRRHMRRRPRLIGREAMPCRIVERRIHQHHVDTVGRKANSYILVWRRRHIERDDVGSDRVQCHIAARKFGELGVDLHQQQLDRRHAPGKREAGGAGAGTEIHYTITRSRRCRRRQQDGVVSGAMARFRLPQAQLSAEECILGGFAEAFSHRCAIRGRGPHR